MDADRFKNVCIHCVFAVPEHNGNVCFAEYSKTFVFTVFAFRKYNTGVIKSMTANHLKTIVFIMFLQWPSIVRTYVSERVQKRLYSLCFAVHESNIGVMEISTR